MSTYHPMGIDYPGVNVSRDEHLLLSKYHRVIETGDGLQTDEMRKAAQLRADCMKIARSKELFR